MGSEISALNFSKFATTSQSLKIYVKTTIWYPETWNNLLILISEGYQIQLTQNLQNGSGDESPMGAAMECNRKGCECCFWIKPNSSLTRLETRFKFNAMGKLICESTNLTNLIEYIMLSNLFVGCYAQIVWSLCHTPSGEYW